MNPMDFSLVYKKQTILLIKLLASIKNESAFALKGGTAINLFLRDLPRLSIDIDLAYLPLNSRLQALNDIEIILLRIATDIKKRTPGVTIIQKRSKAMQNLQKLIVQQDELIKIEPNEVLRGALYPVDKRKLSPIVEELFELSIDEVPVLSVPDLYAGKICAALSRQHPRDWFDIKILLDHEGLTNEIRAAFVCYLAASPRPMHELLMPNMIDFQGAFETEFRGMTRLPITYDELVETRRKLIKTIHHSLTNYEREFLISLKESNPRWELMPFSHLHELPALQWKLHNIQKMDRRKRQNALERLKNVLEL